MGALDNFKTAAKGLFGNDADGLQNPIGLLEGAETGNDEDSREPPAAGIPEEEPQIAAPASDLVEEREIAVVEPQKSTSVVSKGTTITGRIRTDGHLEVLGRVDGNIEAEGDVAIQGRVTGNIKGNYLGLYSCNVKGDLHASSGVIINSESMLVGDVQTQSIVLDGKLKGSVTAAQAAMLKGNAYLIGDITASSISIESGAVVSGMVTTVGGTDNSPFDDF